MANVKGLVDSIVKRVSNAYSTAILDGDFAAAAGALYKTGAGAYVAIKENLTAVVPPAVTDDSAAGYAIGSKWHDVVTGFDYIATDVSAGAAVWVTSQAATAAQAGRMTAAQVVALEATVRDAGSIPSDVLLLGTDPTAGDEFSIGSDVYEYRGAGGQMSDDAHIAILCGAGAPAALVATLATINGTAANPHASILDNAGTAPAGVTNGTEAVVADDGTAIFGASVHVQHADGVGGTPIAGNPNLALTETLTAVGDVWITGDVNLNTLGGSVGGIRQTATMERIITAAMITNSPISVDFPFTPVGFSVSARSTAGVILPIAGDAFVITGDAIVITLAGTGAPALVATDVLVIHAWSAAT